jgi:hypothetical protein
MVADGARDADAARRRQPLQPRRDVDGVAINVAAVGDHVAEIDPDAKSQAALLGEIEIALGHCALNFASTAHRVDHAGKFRQHAVTGGFDDPAVMLVDLRIDQFAQMRLDAFVRAFLIGAHQARIAHHIGREDRGETACGGRCGHWPGDDNFRAEINLLRAGKRRFSSDWSASSIAAHSPSRNSAGSISLLTMPARSVRPARARKCPRPGGTMPSLSISPARSSARSTRSPKC